MKFSAPQTKTWLQMLVRFSSRLQSGYDAWRRASDGSAVTLRVGKCIVTKRTVKRLVAVADKASNSVEKGVCSLSIEHTDVRL
jgi:hypothetical protein